MVGACVSDELYTRVLSLEQFSSPNQNFKISKFQNFKISKFQNFKISKFQNFKISKFQSVGKMRTVSASVATEASYKILN
jgi:hypothetical protein